MQQTIVETQRKAEHDIHPIFLQRWSQRSMSGEDVPDKELMSMFEAARWAPSCFNHQPWRFLFVKRHSPQWRTYFDLLTPFNKEWVKNAAVLAVILSKRTYEHNGEYARTHSFDAGAAWQNLALEGTRRGYVVHGMAGFDYDRAINALRIPPDFSIEAMVAIGKRGKKASLPSKLLALERPSDRKSIKEFVKEGFF